MNPGLTKSFRTSTIIAPYRLAALGASDGVVKLATAATDSLIGVVQQVGATASGQLVDVCMGGLPEIEYGAAVERGDPLTTDNQGRAVPCDPGEGEEERYIGFALSSGGVGLIAGFQFAPGILKGPPESEV